MSTVIKKIAKGAFQKLKLDTVVSPNTFSNLSTLFTGTFISAIIPILFAPVMSRIFTTSDYGILGLYMSISGLIGVLAYIHYPQAIILSKDDDDARQVMWFSIFFCLSISIFSLMLIIPLLLFTQVLDNSALKNWLFLIPLSVLLNGISTSIMVWANRHQRYKILSSNRIIQVIFTVILQISVGLLINNETGLMAGLVGGQFLSAFLLWLRFSNKRPHSIMKPKFQTFREIAFRYRKLLIYTTPSEFINSLINQTPIFLLQKFGGISYVGSYNFTQRLLGVPQQFLSSAIVEVFKQKAAVAYNIFGDCREIFVKTFKALGAIAILPFLILILFAPDLFSFVFGEEWRESGVFARFLGILFFFRFIISPLTYVYIIAGRLKEDFILHLLLLVLTTSSFYIGNQIITDKRYLLLVYSISYSCVYFIYFFRSYQLSKGNHEPI